MFGREFDLIITVVALVCGVLLLSGHGGVLMKSSDKERNKMYDMKKMEKASGIFLVAMGILSGISMFVDNFVFSIIYLVLIIAMFAALIWYYTHKCRR